MKVSIWEEIIKITKIEPRRDKNPKQSTNRQWIEPIIKKDATHYEDSGPDVLLL